jgi:preprotein translocase SecE subunit
MSGVAAESAGASSKGRLTVYKRGQGQYTRWGTFIGAMVLILAGGHFLWNELGVFRREDKQYTLVLQNIIPLMVVVVLGALTYWVSFISPKACNFMIATEGEMKKVNWSSRREIFGSTKVVIMFTVLLTVILFVVDIVFMSFFGWIGVLREAPTLWQMLSGGGS